MNSRPAWLTILLALLTGVANADDCLDAPKGEFLGQLKPVLYVADVEESAVFFRDTLGFTFLNFSGEKGNPYYAEMAAGPTKFGLHEPGSERERARVGRLRLYFRVTDLKAHRNHISSCGGNPGKIQETAWMTMFSVTDPDGHEITFAETDPAVHSIDPW